MLGAKRDVLYRITCTKNPLKTAFHDLIKNICNTSRNSPTLTMVIDSLVSLDLRDYNRVSSALELVRAWNSNCSVVNPVQSSFFINVIKTV